MAFNNAAFPRGRRVLVRPLLTAVLAVLASVAAGDLRAQVATLFAANGRPNGITAGPDGNLWFTENSGGKIGRITPSGVITEFPVDPMAGLQFIASGPDGNLWFTEGARALVAFSPLPARARVILAALMGPLLGIASWGLRQFLVLDRPAVAADLGAISNALAGALLTAMFLVQAATGMRIPGKPGPEAEAVWLGLDVAWDVYLGCGTLLLASSMLRHPKLGRVVGGAGALVALGLLVLNLATFPVPPGNAGLIDLGPVIGLWYLIVTLMVLRSLPWSRQRAEALWPRPDQEHSWASDSASKNC